MAYQGQWLLDKLPRQPRVLPATVVEPPAHLRDLVDKERKEAEVNQNDISLML